MIAAAGIYRPLPVRPIDGTRTQEHAPLRPARTPRTMHPLPVHPHPEPVDLGAALRTAAYERMLDRLGVKDPLPVIDPTA